VAPHPRLDSVDLLRGAVMVVMALDHVRAFFSHDALSFDPTDLTKTNAPLFLTRWVTHFCAPVFFFLAGTGAFLWAARGKTKNELARYLLTRGLWLVFLQLTVVRYFNLDYHIWFGVVIWALGWSMVALAALIYLPTYIIAAIGVIMIAGHNLLDQIRPESFGVFRWLWVILHHPDRLEPLPNVFLFIGYPLVPWIGVTAAGYAFGALLRCEHSERRKRLLELGIGLTVAFIVIRALNVYGDPKPWSVQQSSLYTILSFINCEKYPPSLLFLLMTLGPAMIALALFDRAPGKFARPFVIFGRVPLFYYLVHLPLIHLLAVVFSYARYVPAYWLFTDPKSGPELSSPHHGYSLPVVYLVWLGVLLMLFPVCAWFARLKQRRRYAWLTYF
jgi:uncharacterized membrane protein